mmetsp:Transcript_22323/g.48518  ORF Transcript_22323/g.48518 Transcript_22323/m.48518 type:complete len:523 (+) Transcript_22323:114-1682(+)
MDEEDMYLDPNEKFVAYIDMGGDRALNPNHPHCRKLMLAASKPIWDESNKYDLSPNNLHGFLESLETRGNSYGWTANPDGITYIPEHPEAEDLHADGGDTTYFFDSYATITLDRIIEWENHLLAQRGRGAQDSNMLFHCVNNSLTPDAIARLALDKEKYLHKKLTKIGFNQSKVDECVYWRGTVMYVLYTDDSILAGPNKKAVENAIRDIKDVGLNITEEGDIQDFLGVNIDRQPDGTIKFTQPHLIHQILKDMHLDGDEVKTQEIPASSSKLLKRHTTSKKHDESFKYRSIIGQLGYLEKGSRPDIAYTTHQCARFSADPKVEHASALRWLAKYLKGTKDKGFVMRPDQSKGLEVFVDADFAGNWDQEESNDRDTARSRHGYVIMYMGCPIVWKSQLQTEIALSTTESELIGLSQALREAIPLMEMLKELRDAGFEVGSSQAQVHCKVFEDNSGALEIAKEHKYRPRTKHINVKYHHFRDYVDRKEISIHKIDTLDQLADMLTKPLNKELLHKHRKRLQGW